MTSTPLRQIVSGADPLAIDIDVVNELLCGFLKEEIGKAGFERAVVGVSGGVDSALVAALACRSLGPENVLGIIMPYRASNPASERDARAVCEQLRLEPLLMDISPQIDAYFERFPDAGSGRRGNKMARERMTILYDQSWAFHGLVLGTSNKTEMLLGYSTIFGDMAHALNPLGDLYKTQVYALARSVDLPQAVLDKAPSADLWEGQTDEDELGLRYALVDMLLYYLVDERRTRPELRVLGYDDEVIDDVMRRVRTSQYKRRPPLIAKLTARTIDREFRYPRDWGA
ncbi:MAG TPA: NAD+ synthase [Candidatus Sulfotelmatobacter sp.]|nr:NAD+ synthase [Candidatus Sulfotelmatobacter sp.]